MLGIVLNCGRTAFFLSYSTIVLYIRVGFLAKNITLKPASQYFHGTLAVLVRYNQAQKHLQYDLKHFQKVATEFYFYFVEFSTD